MALCKCVFLDGKEVFLTVEKDATGSDLFDSICEYVGITFRDPFGVAFRGGAAPAPYSWWVRMDKSITGQIPGKCKIWEFAFLVKYYPKSLGGMQDAIARHHVTLQIRQDLLTGRLKCPVQTMSHLCSYWLQADYGDWSSRHIDMQLADAFRFVQKGEQTSNEREEKSDLDFVEQMMQMHQAHRGMSTLDAEYRFIRLAASLPNYGIHYYPSTCMFLPATQQQGTRRSSIRSMKGDSATKREKVTIGVGPMGIHQFRRRGNETVFTWKAMRAVSFKKNRIVLKMQGALRQDVDTPEEDQKSKMNITKEYEFPDMFQTKIVWQVMIEYHMFFRVGDQQGLKGNQRKQLLSSLKMKRAIPMVGEKTMEAQPKSPTAKDSPKSSARSRFSLSGRASRKRSSSLPPSRAAGNDGADDAKSTTSERFRYEADADLGKSPVTRNAQYKSTDGVATNAKPSGLEHTRSPDSLNTPMSGTFVFPQRSTRSRASSVGRAPTTSAAAEDIQLDDVSVASFDTDELCNPDVIDSGYRKAELSPRSQSSAYSEVPKLQLDGINSKYESSEGVPNSGGRGFEGGPFVIPAEILIEDLRKCRKMKGQERKAESGRYEFPMELDKQPRRSQYLHDADLINAYDEEFAKHSSGAGRRTKSLMSLRTRPKGTEARSSPRDRSLSPMSDMNVTVPKSVHGNPRIQQLQARQKEKARSESQLPQTRPLTNPNSQIYSSSGYVSRLSEKRPDARSSSRERSLSPMSDRNQSMPRTTKESATSRLLRGRYPQRAKSESKLPQQAAASRNRGPQAAGSSGHVAQLSGKPVIKPRRSIQLMSPTEKHEDKARTDATTMIEPHGGIYRDEALSRKQQKPDTLPKIPMSVRSDV